MTLYAPYLTRKRVIQVKIESTKGTYEAPDTDVLVWDLAINSAESWIERKYSAKSGGHTAAGINDGTGAAVLSFKTELRGDGSQAMNAALAILVQACGVKQAAQVYTPDSDHADQKCISAAVYGGATSNGQKKMLKGCTGTFSMDTEPGRVIFDFEFFGVWIAPVEASLPTVAYSTRAPISWGYSGNSFTLNSQAIKISKATFALNNQVTPRFNMGAVSYYLVTDRDPTLTIDPEADSPSSDHDLYGDWLAGTQRAAVLALADADDTFTLTMPKLQYRPPAEGDRDGIMIDEVVGQCNSNTPDTSVGDDEFSLAVTAT